MGEFGKCPGGGRRTAPRELAPLLAVYTTVTRSHSADLIDVSVTGARLRSPVPPDEGQDVLVSIGRVRAFGTVAWVREKEFAVGFDEPISTGDLAILRSVVKSGRGFTPQVKAAIDDWVLGIAD
jgi:PilZ domain